MFLCAIFDAAFNFNSRFSRFVHEVKCDRSWLVAYSILSVVYDCTPFVKRLNEVAVSFIISLRSAIFVPWIITLWQEDTGNIFQLLHFSQVPHALLTRFRHNPRFSKVRRRCGRGRHGRPWPCEWDVGREPDRDERSEPPTATPPIGLVKKQCKRLQPLHIAGRCHICFCNDLIHRELWNHMWISGQKIFGNPRLK